MPVLRRLLAELAPRSAPLVAGSPVAEASVGAADLGSLQAVESSGTAAYCLEVPDLGPAVVADQLAVLVWDAYAARRGIGIPDLLARARHDLG